MAHGEKRVPLNEELLLVADNFNVPDETVFKNYIKLARDD